jgi:hypothetical protein
MKLCRYTGLVMGLLAGVFVSSLMARSLAAMFGNAFDNYAPLLFILVIPLALLGYGFDSLWVRRRLARYVPPQYAGWGNSVAYWMAVTPAIKVSNDLLLAGYFAYFKGEEFVVPYYLTTWGFDGIIGYLIYQIMVGMFIGVGFYMGYQRIFQGLTLLERRIFNQRSAA